MVAKKDERILEPAPAPVRLHGNRPFLEAVHKDRLDTQSELTALDVQYQKDRRALQDKYNKLRDIEYMLESEESLDKVIQYCVERACQNQSEENLSSSSTKS